MTNVLTRVGFAAACAVAAIATTGATALADGMPSQSIKDYVPEAPRCANFAGFYVGGFGSYNTYTSHRTDLGDFNGGGFLNGQTESDSSLGGGVQAGYNVQRGCTVFGIQADYDWSRVSTSVVYSGSNPVNPAAVFGVTSNTNHIDGIATIRTRGGIVVDNMMLYLTGGLAFADVKTQFIRNRPATPTFNTVNFSETQTGFVAGAGLEYSLTKNISLTSEVLYMNFGDWNRSAIVDPNFYFNNYKTFTGSDEIWSTRMAINYRF